ncbi:hypothetical protein [Microbacterium sp.]|uniref:hypothetical protein n=1 Tax=Microbacterium sp. TaxID=51671 RepID=UPI003C73BF51
MLIRNLGTVLLGLGFVMLAAAALIRDPTALDANIGAGGLTLIGIPVGTLGLALTITHAVYMSVRRRRSAHTSAS